MDSEQVIYSNGQRIHAGDRVQYRGTYATVVFVTDGDESESSAGYENYAGYDRGIIIRDDDAVLTSLNEADEGLVLISRNM